VCAAGKGLAPGAVAGEGLRELRASAVAMAQGYHFVIAGVDARKLDRSFIGFRSAVAEEALRDFARSNLRDLFRQRDDGLVWEQGRSVRDLIDLCLDLRCNARIRVADGNGDDAAEEVEILFALDVPQILHAGMICDQRICEVVRDRRK